MPDDDRTTPAAAFELVGDEVRAGIVGALQDAYREGERSLGYADLQRRVGVEDSGRFNYHLTKLLGRFVAKDEGAYRLTYAGRKVASAIAAGTFDGEASVRPAPVEGRCYACGDERLVLSYREELCRVDCDACGEAVVHMPFPPGAVEAREAAGLERAFDRWTRSWNALARAGVCPECGGEVATGLAETTAGEPTVGDVAVRAALECHECWVRGYLPVGCLLVDHPAVVAFYWQHGRHVGERHLWEYEWAVSAAFQRVAADGDRVSVRVPVDDDELTVVVDDSLRVRETVERRRPGSG